MTSKVEGSENRLDALKWLAVALLVAVGVVGNQYFSAEPILYRVLVLLVLAHGHFDDAVLAVGFQKGELGLLEDGLAVLVLCG